MCVIFILCRHMPAGSFCSRSTRSSVTRLHMHKQTWIPKTECVGIPAGISVRRRSRSSSSPCISSAVPDGPISQHRLHVIQVGSVHAALAGHGCAANGHMRSAPSSLLLHVMGQIGSSVILRSRSDANMLHFAKFQMEEKNFIAAEGGHHAASPLPLHDCLRLAIYH